MKLLPLGTGSTPTPLVESPFTDWVAALSPDGQWIAYVSDESGTLEVYVKQVAGPVKHRVSVGGGVQPRWRRDGRELFFLDDNGQLMSAAMREGPIFATDRPQPLFHSCLGPGKSSPFMYVYDVLADGSRSLWICRGEASMQTTVLVHGLSPLLAR